MRTSLVLLGIISLPATAAAVDVGEGVRLDGFVEGFALGEQRGEHSPRHSTTAANAGEDETAIDFNADALVGLGYAVDEFSLRADIFASNAKLDDDQRMILEQAFVDWQVRPELTVRAGRFRTTWLGWEGFHTPELWRVRHSAAWDWNVANHTAGPRRTFAADGAGLRWRPADSLFAAELYVVDDVLGDGSLKRSADVAVGGNVSAKSGLGRAELGWCWDPRSTVTADGSGSAATAVDFNVDLTAWREAGWFFAGEAQFHRHPDFWFDGETYGNDLVLLAMANYSFAETKSATLMVDYVDRGLNVGDNSLWEVAVALLTRPRKQARLDFEVFTQLEEAGDADTVGAAAVLNLALP